MARDGGSATEGFNEMGYERGMGMDTTKSISGTMSTSVRPTDVSASARGLAKCGVWGSESEGKRHVGRKKERKARR